MQRWCPRPSRASTTITSARSPASGSMQAEVERNGHPAQDRLVVGYARREHPLARRGERDVVQQRNPVLLVELNVPDVPVETDQRLHDDQALGARLLLHVAIDRLHLLD